MKQQSSQIDSGKYNDVFLLAKILCNVDLNKEEKEKLFNYFRKRSINIFDLIDEEQREHDILYEPTYNPDDGSM